jgi:hypothetical protein
MGHVHACPSGFDPIGRVDLDGLARCDAPSLSGNRDLRSDPDEKVE